MAILFGCPDCGKTMRVGDSQGGKRCKCPGCGTLLAIPALDKATTGKAMPRPPAAASQRPVYPDQERPPRRRGDPDDRELTLEDNAGGQIEPQARNRGKKQGKGVSGWVLWLCLGGGGLAMLGAGLLIWWKASGGGGAGRELNYFPDDYTSVVYNDHEAMRQSGCHDALRKCYGGEEMWGGIRTDNVLRTITASGGSDFVHIIEVKTRVSAESIKQKLQSNFKETKVGGQTIYEPDFGEAFFVEGEFIVRGYLPTLKAILRRRARAKTSERMETAMKKSSLTGGMRTVSLESDALGIVDIKHEGMVVNGTYGDAQIATTITVYFRDAQEASEGRKEVDDQIGKARQKADGDQKRILERVSISQSGSTVILEMSIPIDKLDLFREIIRL